MKNQNGESVEKILEEVAIQGVAAVAAWFSLRISTPENKMSKDPLHIYLAKERDNGAYSFSLRVQPPRYIGDTEVRFMIHPELQSGETNDYSVSEDPERRDADFIYNLAAVAEPDVAAFVAKLAEHRLNRELLG